MYIDLANEFSKLKLVALSLSPFFYKLCFLTLVDNNLVDLKYGRLRLPSCIFIKVR